MIGDTSETKCSDELCPCHDPEAKPYIIQNGPTKQHHERTLAMDLLKTLSPQEYLRRVCPRGSLARGESFRDMVKRIDAGWREDHPEQEWHEPAQSRAQGLPSLKEPAWSRGLAGDNIREKRKMMKSR